MVTTYLAEIPSTLTPPASFVGLGGLFAVSLGLFILNPQPRERDVPRLRLLWGGGMLCAGISFAIRVLQAFGVG